VGDLPLVPLIPLQGRSGSAPDLPPAATAEPPAALLGERLLPLMTQSDGDAPDAGPPAPSPVPAARVQRWLAPGLPYVAAPRGRTALTTDQLPRGTTGSGAPAPMQRRTASSTAPPRAQRTVGPASRDPVDPLRPAVPPRSATVATTVPATDPPGSSRAADALGAVQVAPAVAQRFGGTASASPPARSVSAPTPGLDSAVAAVVRSGVATFDPDGSLRFAPPAEPADQDAGPAIQREAGDTTPPAEVSQAPPATAEASAATATPDATPPAASAGHAETGPGDLDDLARRLYERIRARLRAELRLDMERAGMLTRPGR
jgi:hypothetical protein